MTTPACPTCADGSKLFEAAMWWGPDEAWWCPKCSGYFTTSRAAPSPAPAPTTAVVSTREMDRIGFEIRVEPTGAIRLKLDLGPKHEAEWTVLPAELRRFTSGASRAAAAAERVQEHLRGADRFAFFRKGGQIYARIWDHDARLSHWRSGGRQERAEWPGSKPTKLPERRCDACDAELPRGAAGYRAEPVGGYSYRVTWSEVRFCTRCPEDAKDVTTTERPVLRAIDGGKAGGATGS